MLNTSLIAGIGKLCRAIPSCFFINIAKYRADTEILKRGGALCGPPWLADEENFRFQMV